MPRPSSPGACLFTKARLEPLAVHDRGLWPFAVVQSSHPCVRTPGSVQARRNQGEFVVTAPPSGHRLVGARMAQRRDSLSASQLTDAETRLFRYNSLGAKDEPAIMAQVIPVIEGHVGLEDGLVATRETVSTIQSGGRAVWKARSFWPVRRWIGQHQKSESRRNTGQVDTL